MTEAPVRALVVDDEPAARDVITTLLAEHEQIVVVGEASNGKDAVQLVRQLRPDLLFLDIQMPDQNGFGVLDELGADVPRGVVFVTAHDEHAVRAFEMHALDYVLKPFGRPRFGAAVTRALERLSALDALTVQRTLASMAEDRRSFGGAAGELSIDESSRRAPPQRIGVRIGTKSSSSTSRTSTGLKRTAITPGFTSASRCISSRCACTHSSVCWRRRRSPASTAR
jgi:two-component system, LytTR family, response regulator